MLSPPLVREVEGGDKQVDELALEAPGDQFEDGITGLTNWKIRETVLRADLIDQWKESINNLD